MASCPVLSCSAPASMTVHLPACLARVQLLATCSRESPASPSRDTLFSCTLLSKLHSISLTTLTSNPPKYRRVFSELRQSRLRSEKSPRKVASLLPSSLALSSPQSEKEGHFKVPFGHVSFIIFKIENQEVVEKLGIPDEAYEDFTTSQPASERCFAVFNFDFITDQSFQKSKLFFIAW
uniref:ADF-H domain-containing protein n=1 Tax=Quercus lobata TaxID=97700 RepID=A0A7N2MI18_QUELO